MDSKFLIIGTALVVIIALCVTSSEGTPVATDLEIHANLVPNSAPEIHNSPDKVLRKGRQYFGYPYGGYGGGSTATAAATASATSMGSGYGGYPYGGFYGR